MKKLFPERAGYADFVVLNPQATPLVTLRNPEPTAPTLESLADLVFSLVMMGSDRAVSTTYILGNLAFKHPVSNGIP